VKDVADRKKNFSADTKARWSANFV